MFVEKIYLTDLYLSKKDLLNIKNLINQLNIKYCLSITFDPNNLKTLEKDIFNLFSKKLITEIKSGSIKDTDLKLSLIRFIPILGDTFLGDILKNKEYGELLSCYSKLLFDYIDSKIVDKKTVEYLKLFVQSPFIILSVLTKGRDYYKHFFGSKTVMLYLDSRIRSEKDLLDLLEKDKFYKIISSLSSVEQKIFFNKIKDADNNDIKIYGDNLLLLYDSLFELESVVKVYQDNNNYQKNKEKQKNYFSVFKEVEIIVSE